MSHIENNFLHSTELRQNNSYLRQGGIKFVCSVSGIMPKKILSRFSQNSVENVAHGLQEKSLHFAGNPDRVTLGLGLPPYSSREDVLPVFV